MKMFNKAHFLGSFLKSSDIPQRFSSEHGTPLPEIAFVGRSNVGKSSLINHLLQKKIARVSQTPGKTQTINFFSVDENLCFVDLPGYGFAKVPMALKEKWKQSLGDYFTGRTSLHLIFFLLDIRRTPSKEDLSFIQFALHYQIPLYIVFTKCDKLTMKEKNTCESQWKSWMRDHRLEFAFIYYSIKDQNCRKKLMGEIDKVLNGPT